MLIFLCQIKLNLLRQICGNMFLCYILAQNLLLFQQIIKMTDVIVILGRAACTMCNAK